MPQTDDRPAGDAVASTREICHSFGSISPCFHALPSSLNSPSFTLRHCRRSIVHEPDSQMNGALATTSSPFTSSTSFLAGDNCSLKPPTPFKPTANVGKRRPLPVPCTRAETARPDASVGPNNTPNVSSGAPGSSRNLFPPSSFTAKPPSSTIMSSGTFSSSALSKPFVYRTCASAEPIAAASIKPSK